MSERSIIGAFFVWTLLVLAVWGGVIYVALHFIGKWW